MNKLRTSTLALFLLGLFLLSSGVLLYAGFLSRPTEKEHGLLIERSPITNLANVHDFVLFYAAGKLANNCQPGESPYEHQHYNQTIAELTYPLKPYSKFTFQYPPCFLVLLKPLALLDMQKAWCTWSIFSILLQLACSLALSWTKSAGAKALAILGAVFAFPAFSNFYEGQSSAVLLFSLTSMFCFLRAKQPFAAGLLSSLGFLKLQYAPAIFLIGIFCARLPYLKGLLLGLAAIALGTLISAGPESFIDFPKSLLAAELHGGGHMDTGGMANFRAFLHNSCGLSGLPELVVAGLAYLLSLLSLLILWRKYWRPDNDNSFLICASLSVLLLLAFSVHTWVYDYLSALIPCLWLWYALSESRAANTKKTRILASVLRVLVYIFPILCFPTVLSYLCSGQGWYLCFIWAAGVLVLAASWQDATMGSSIPIKLTNRD